MQVSTFELVVFTIGLILTLIGAFWLLLTLLFTQFEKNITSQFAALEEDAKEWKRLEKDFLIFQRDLATHYVRREDYIRNHTVMESKLDSLAKMLQDWQKEVYRHER